MCGQASDLAGAHVQAAVKDIAALLARAGIDDLFGAAEDSAASSERDEPKQMDVIAARAPEPAVRGCDPLHALFLTVHQTACCTRGGIWAIAVAHETARGILRSCMPHGHCWLTHVGRDVCMPQDAHVCWPHACQRMRIHHDSDT